ncbi:polysaccharide lyase family 14 protein [Moniliophthora roreri MCA 2997]|uniref:Polysaccharide lyase family 14 protein n=2 Tax=Moniliophthora roreri TaxID=221103 RepID=V2WYK0_MONRO|nr:polysaccharide lyase family 14 protein [Moniliophthora roreri MCA 2997]KAI3616030.1 polysaccharide lyase family 14 protein [Moniliophthora roreri]
MSLTTFILLSSTFGLVSPLPSLSDPDSATTARSSTQWSMPAHITNLSKSFNVTKFCDDQRNIRIVNEAQTLTAHDDPPFPGIPSSSSLRTSSAGKDIIQILYPKGSINPKNNILGGTEFYASPIDITTAKNVTFAYSVFFPKDFDFVKGGKLPGLYGGHEACSGGRGAHACFSTRMMWRSKGAGELYLYAPKDKQNSSVCSSPGSVCDSTYGISIGRGSFYWAPGGWTCVSQTVMLNTPGKQDGCFTLDVNGKRVIDRCDLLYRDEDQSATRRRRQVGSLLDQDTDMPENGDAEWEEKFDEKISELDGRRQSLGISGSQARASADAVGFAGMFFSTFFGGHTSDWASPRDQYVWFKDLAISYNA